MMSPFIRIQISLTMTIPPSINDQQVRQWLMVDGFCFESPEYLSADGKNSEPSATVERLVYYWLFFHQQILIEAGIPYFKPAEINRIEQVAGHRYQVTLVLSPVAEFQPLVVNSLSTCLPFLYDMNDTLFDWDAYAALSMKVYRKLYLPLRKVSNSGLSTIPILRYVYKRGIPFMYLGAGIYQLGWGANSHLIHNSSTEQDSAIGATLSGYKYFSANRLRSLGLPAAHNRLADTLEKAINIAHEIGYPVVIKPEQGNRGEGVVKDVDSDDQLRLAWQVAIACNPLVVVEKQVSGTCHRLFVYDDEVMYVKGTLPRSITGDGHSSVAELIAADAAWQKKRRPWQRDPEIPLDKETLSCLSAQGVSTVTIPLENQSLFVRKIGSMSWGIANSPNVTQVHPENLRLAVDAAKAMNLCTAGVDVIIADIARPWHEQECIINEVNSSPMIGVSDVSLHCVPKLVGKIIDHDGRIPVSVYVGQHRALESAKKAQQQGIASGQNCFLTSGSVTYDGEGKVKAMTFTSLHERCLALIMNRAVESLILVVNTDEPVVAGLPVDRIHHLVYTEEELFDHDGEMLDQKRCEAVLSFLEKIVEHH